MKILLTGITESARRPLDVYAVRQYIHNYSMRISSFECGAILTQECTLLNLCTLIGTRRVVSVQQVLDIRKYIVSNTIDSLLILDTP